MQYLWSIKQSQRDLRNWAELNTILKQKHGRELTIMVTEFFMPMKKIPYRKTSGAAGLAYIYSLFQAGV